MNYCVARFSSPPLVECRSELVAGSDALGERQATTQKARLMCNSYNHLPAPRMSLLSRLVHSLDSNSKSDVSELRDLCDITFTIQSPPIHEIVATSTTKKLCSQPRVVSISAITQATFFYVYVRLQTHNSLTLRHARYTPHLKTTYWLYYYTILTYSNLDPRHSASFPAYTNLGHRHARRTYRKAKVVFCPE